ncbi:MAG: formimidoylglutamate deiminase, partial [Arenimonas sp.]
MSELLKIAGMPNLHSHAFQRAMAGLTERQTNPNDSFWTWRELMYRFASRITPEQLQAIASQLYVEMLEAGYTSVCEFHYLHHQPNGRPYENSAAMSQAIIQAAQDTGIRLTLLPVLYMTGGFDGRALNDQQKRFSHGVEDFLGLITKLQTQENDSLKIGIALHSLRAVPEQAINEVLAGLPGKLPIHIHISEQMAEVNDCIATRNARPVQWLMDKVNVNQDWTFVHATHLDDTEVTSIAKSKATVAICTTTEANLGDGFFRLHDFIARGGAFGVGSDSNTSISPVEELRWLEYGQRLLN